MGEEFLRSVYELETQEETNAYYSAWAATYDEEVTRQGYRSPQRCAEALAQFAPLDVPVLDIGCGTGISGVALAAVGFTDVSGEDVNAEMLERARATGIYRKLRITDLAAPFPFEPGTYGAIAAVGVIGIGAAPSSVLAEALDALAPGGHLVFSYNERVLAVPEYTQAIDDVIAAGTAEQLFRERGPHFEGLESSSDVFVLRRC